MLMFLLMLFLFLPFFHFSPSMWLLHLQFSFGVKESDVISIKVYIGFYSAIKSSSTSVPNIYIFLQKQFKKWKKEE